MDICAALETTADKLEEDGRIEDSDLVRLAAEKMDGAISLLDNRLARKEAAAWVAGVTQATPAPAGAKADPLSEYPYAKMTVLQREEQFAMWRKWALDPSIPANEQVSRKAISAAWLRLSRLEPGFQAEVSHAMHGLECALHGKLAAWP